MGWDKRGRGFTNKPVVLHHYSDREFRGFTSGFHSLFFIQKIFKHGPFWAFFISRESQEKRWIIIQLLKVIQP